MPATPPPFSAITPAAGYVRQQSAFTGQISRDGSSGYLAEPARYQLYASLACPWSQQALIVRRLLGLEQVIGLSLTDPIRDEHGWRFPASQGGRDPVTGARFLSELYQATDPAYSGWCTVPCVWDTLTQRIVTNDIPQITVTSRPSSPTTTSRARRSCTRPASVARSRPSAP
jgi:putative glutathione S-transferase